MTPSARDIAIWALTDRAGNVSASIERLLGRNELSPEDRNLAHELALGTIRRRETLKAVMAAHLIQPDRRLPGVLDEIILVALYQLLFLTRIPQYAVVDEAVEQASRFRHRRQAGLINGLLRTVARNVTDVQAAPPPLASDVLPLDAGSFRRFSKPIFPDPADDPAGYLSAACSLPKELARRWVGRWGEQKVFELACHANARPPLILRPNLLRTTADGLIESLAREGVPASGHANGQSVVLEGHRNVRELEAFRAGLFQPQDATASAVVVAARPQAGQKILDFCAAPGTKTTQMAEMMGDDGSITALDVSPEKLSTIENNCRRLGISIVRTALADSAGALPQKDFDLVLVDVPCSNTGVLARRPEARWRFSEESLEKIVRDQRFLLAAGASFVKPGGKLVYSTCSIEAEENDELARAFAGREGNFKLIDDKFTLPSGADNPINWHDGGYYAIYRRQ